MNLNHVQQVQKLSLANAENDLVNELENPLNNQGDIELNQDHSDRDTSDNDLDSDSLQIDPVKSVNKSTRRGRLVRRPPGSSQLFIPRHSYGASIPGGGGYSVPKWYLCAYRAKNPDPEMVLLL